jgi:hypothetical protein
MFVRPIVATEVTNHSRQIGIFPGLGHTTFVGRATTGPSRETVLDLLDLLPANGRAPASCLLGNAGE